MDICLASKDRDFLRAVREGLRGKGFAPFSEMRADSLTETLRSLTPRALILDLDMEEKPPWKLLRSICAGPLAARMPVLAVSSRYTASRWVVASLRLGAMEHMAKPCDIEVLIARLETLLKIFSRRRAVRIFVLKTSDGRLALDLRAHNCLIHPSRRAAAERDRGPRKVNLTPMEFLILRHLLTNRNAMVGKEELLRAAWRPGSLRATDTAQTLAQHISQLRRKLRDLGSRLVTVWGMGYRFED